MKIQAQYPVEQTTQLWTAISASRPIQGLFLGFLEIDYNKELSRESSWYEIATQPSLEYYPNYSIDLFGGIYLSYVNQNKQDNTFEVRPFLGLRWNIIKPEHKVFLRTQLKYEYRHFRDMTTDTNTNASRLRIRIGFKYSINKSNYHEVKNLYLIVRPEYFLNLDSNVQERFWNKHRAELGLGYRFNRTWQLEGTYMNQGSKDTLDQEDFSSIDHIGRISLRYTHQVKK